MLITENKGIGYCALGHPCRRFLCPKSNYYRPPSRKYSLQKRAIIECTQNSSKCWVIWGILTNNPVSRWIFPKRWAAQTPYTSSWVITTICRLYSKISHYNKFDFTKSLGVCYWCFKMPQCFQNATMRCMEYGLKHNTIYVKKNIFVNVL